MISYTVPFMLVHAGKYRTEDKLKYRQNTETKHDPKRQTTQTKLAWFSRLLWHSTRKQGGLIIQCSRAHMGQLDPIMFTSIILNYSLW